MIRKARRVAILGAWVLALPIAAAASDEPATVLELDGATRERCLAVLRAGLASDEFWPSMHAAEGLSLDGHGAEVRASLEPRLATEDDDQRRCGLGRELVRAGDLARVRVLLDVLVKPDPYGHTHAAESLFKVRQIGDGLLLRAVLERAEDPKRTLMAAAALARWGHRGALDLIRRSVADDDGETARTAAWILARTGDASDVPALRAGAERFSEALTRAYFEHALAALGDEAGRSSLVENLRHEAPAVRVYAAEFAPEARAIEARDALVGLLDDPVLDARVRAAQALLQLARPEPEDARAPFHRDVFPATEEHPRYSEGSVLVRRDSSLLYATTEFRGSGSDFATARIVAVESADGGRTWSSPRVLQENVGRQNVMSVTLRRLRVASCFDGPIGFFYLVKNSTSDLNVFLRTSDDEGATFGEPVRVTDAAGYHVLNNDRVTVLTTGRLVVPVATTPDVADSGHFESRCYVSDDEGRTWERGIGSVDFPKRGAMEPEVVELTNGDLLMHVRTQLGHIAVSESSDGGATWTEARSWGVRAPEAPATVRRIPSTGDLLLIWNDTYRDGADHGGKRTPLTAAVSTDEGRTWSYRRDLETDPDRTYAYTSLFFHEGRALMTYYVRDEATGRISSRFRSVPIAWFYEAKAGP